MSDQETIQELQTKLETLEAKHSLWAHATDLATILTPSILLVGGFFAQRSMANDSAALTTSLNHQKENLDIELEKIRDSRQAFRVENYPHAAGPVQHAGRVYRSAQVASSAAWRKNRRAGAKCPSQNSVVRVEANPRCRRGWLPFARVEVPMA